MQTKQIIRRLSIIKYLFNSAVEQSHKPEPVKIFSLLTFHDAIELFMQLACEHRNVENKNQSFIEYWSVLAPGLPEGYPTQKESIKRLNRARVDFKHHGIMPSKDDLDAFRLITASIFEENTPVIFGIEMADVTLTDLILNKEVKEHLNLALEKLKSSQQSDALHNISVGFLKLIKDYETNKETYYRSIFIHNEIHSFGVKYYGKDEALNEIVGYVEKSNNAIEELQHLIKLIGFGIDLKRYARFAHYMPITHEMADHSYKSHVKSADELSKEVLDFCIIFVIESALILQEYDYEISTPHHL